MSAATERAFERLARNVVTEASLVQCSIAEYLDGLTTIRDEIDVAMAAAREDLKARCEDED